MGGGLDWIFAVCFCLMSVSSLGCDSDVSWQCSVVETADMEGVCVCAARADYCEAEATFSDHQ